MSLRRSCVTCARRFITATPLINLFSHRTCCSWPCLAKHTETRLKEMLT